MMLPTLALLALPLTLPLDGLEGPDVDSDRDGLSDFHEVHKHLTDPRVADTDGDGIPDGEPGERHEYTYVVRSIVEALRPVTPEYLTDDFQDVRVLSETSDRVQIVCLPS